MASITPSAGYLARIRAALDPHSRFMRAIAARVFTAKARAKLYRKIATRVRAGHQVFQVLSELQQRRARRSASDSTAVVLAHVIERIEGQRGGVADAIRPYVPDDEYQLIDAGERADELADKLDLARDQLGRGRRIRSAIVAAMAPPALLFAVTLGFVVFVAVYVVPRFKALIDVDEVSGLGRWVIVAADAVSSWGFAVSLALLLVAAIVAFFTLDVWTGRVRAVADRIPPWSLYRLMHGTSWMLSVGALLRAGTQLSVIVDRAHATGGPWMAERMAAVQHQLERGEANLGVALERTGYGFPDPELNEDLVSYGDLPTFSDDLYDLALEFIRDTVEAVEARAGAFRAAAEIAMVVVIVVIAVGLMTIINDISTTVQSGAV